MLSLYHSFITLCSKLLVCCSKLSCSFYIYTYSYFHSPLFSSLFFGAYIGPIYQRILDEGITVFSIAHRLQLRKFHKFELRLEGDGSGGWKLNPITDSQ